VIRVALTTILGYFAALQLPGLLGFDARWGVAGLTASAGVSGWVEFFLLRRALAARIGAEPVEGLYLLRLWVAAVVAAGAAWAVKLTWPVEQPQLSAVTTLVPFGLLYLLIAGPRELLKAR
jgi:putative peptidoglycan lipid II flippase